MYPKLVIIIHTFSGIYYLQDTVGAFNANIHYDHLDHSIRPANSNEQELPYVSMSVSEQ